MAKKWQQTYGEDKSAITSLNIQWPVGQYLNITLKCCIFSFWIHLRVHTTLGFFKKEALGCSCACLQAA
jgi:hypothetical protein